MSCSEVDPDIGVAAHDINTTALSTNLLLLLLLLVLLLGLVIVRAILSSLNFGRLVRLRGMGSLIL